MMQKISVQLLISLALICYTRSQECNAKTASEFLEDALNLPSFSSSITTGVSKELEVIFPSRLLGTGVRLVEVDSEDNTGDTAGSFWTAEKLRLADGFVAEFSFNVTGDSDGFAFVAQNDKIENIQGNLGASLGFKNGLDNFLAVGFDFCVDRASCAGSIKVSVVRNPDIEINHTLISASKIKKDNSKTHTVIIYYLANLNTLEVELDNELILSTSLGINNTPETIWGAERFAYVGFTASNSGSQPANIDVRSLIISKFISEAKIRNGIEKREVGVNSAVSVLIDIVDNCNNLSPDVAAIRNISTDSFEAFLLFDSNGAEVQIPPIKIERISAATFNLVFDVRFLGTYSFVATVNGVEIQGTPVEEYIVASNGFQLPAYALAILISVLVLLALASVYVVRRLLRYRSKLLTHGVAIDWGHEKERIDNLDKDVIYQMNKLVTGDADDMRRKLRENEEELARMRNGQVLEDSEYTLAQLQRENQELIAKLNDIKKTTQQNEVMNVRRSLRKFLPTSNRKEFNQERASMVKSKSPTDNGEHMSL